MNAGVDMFTKILDFNVFNEDKESLMNYVEGLDKVNIISGNPEVLFNGLNNSMLHKSFNDKDSIIIPDGVGTVIASKLIKEPVKEKIAGIDVVREVLIKADKEGRSVYFLGATEEVVLKCVKNIKEDYPNLNIAGYHNGFFDLNNCEDIIGSIKESRPWAVLVAMGSPRQEIFIEKIKNISETSEEIVALSEEINSASEEMDSSSKFVYELSKELGVLADNTLKAAGVFRLEKPEDEEWK